MILGKHLLRAPKERYWVCIMTRKGGFGTCQKIIEELYVEGAGEQEGLEGLHYELNW